MLNYYFFFQKSTVWFHIDCLALKTNRLEIHFSEHRLRMSGKKHKELIKEVVS